MMDGRLPPCLTTRVTRDDVPSSPRGGRKAPEQAHPGDRGSGPSLAKTRALLASVEELRALLAPLSEEDRRRVLELARSLRRKGEGAT